MELEPINPDALERYLDPRSTDELLKGIPNIAMWGDTPDNETDWWKSPRNYPFYAGISAFVRPTSVLEIGVRYGYSLVSIHRGYPAIQKILGIDNQADHQASQMKAMENIITSGYKGALSLPRGTSKDLAALPEDELFDLIHVDGNHGEEGARNDILAVWPRLRRGGFMIVDDTDYHPDVKKACDSLKVQLPHLVTFFYFPTFRGWAVAKKTPL